MPRARDSDNLTPQEAKFCLLITKGCTQEEAYMQAYPGSRAKKNTIQHLGCKLARKPQCKIRIRELFQAMKTSDLDSQSQTYKDLLDALSAAHQAGNWTAFASLMRLRMSHQGMLKENLSISSDTMPDEILLQRLAGDDPAKQTTLRSILGSPGFAKPH